MWKGVEYLAPLVVLAFAIFLGGKVDAFFPVPAIISSLRCVPQRSAVSWAHAADEDKDDQRVFWDVVEKVGGGHHWHCYALVLVLLSAVWSKECCMRVENISSCVPSVRVGV